MNQIESLTNLKGDNVSNLFSKETFFILLLFMIKLQKKKEKHNFEDPTTLLDRKRWKRPTQQEQNCMLLIV